MRDKVVGISLGRRDQFKPDMVFTSKSVKRNARFALTDRLEVNLDHVWMPAGNGRE